MIALRIMITPPPALVAYVAVVGRQMLGKNLLRLLGSITGAMTSAPALSVVTDAVRSSVPLARPSTNTFVNVLLTFAAALMMVLECQ
jgi:putative transport protein